MHQLFSSLFHSFFGLGILILGGYLVVYSGSQIASRFHISPLIVGLTIVAFGTSASELTFCSIAAYREEVDIVFGAIIGSNLANLLFVLPIAALVAPLYVTKKIVWIQVPLIIVMSGIFWFCGYFFGLSKLVGAFFFLLLFFYLFYLARQIPSQHRESKTKSTSHPLWVMALLFLLSFILLGVGAEWLIQGIQSSAEYYQISKLFLALTVVAIGTSLPELVTSIIAVAKKKSDLAVGNILGSNIFNLLAVGGISGLISPNTLHLPKKSLVFDLPFLFFSSLLALPLFITGHKINRYEACLFLLYYLFFLLLRFEESFNPLIFPRIKFIFWAILVPLTILTISIDLVLHYKRK